MAKLDNLRRIKVEDFDPEVQDTIEKLAEILNSHMDQVINTVNGNIDIDNLNREQIQIEVTVNSNGIPINNNRFSAASGFKGSVIKRVDNLTNPTALLTSAPYMSFVASGQNLYTINSIVGLQANNRYLLTIELSP